MADTTALLATGSGIEGNSETENDGLCALRSIRIKKKSVEVKKYFISWNSPNVKV